MSRLRLAMCQLSLLFTIVCLLTYCWPSPAAVPGRVNAVSASAPATDPVILAIRDEGLNRSEVEHTLDHLCNVIGQRLTASPSQVIASQWTCDQLKQWGLENAHTEPWGPFGRGWSLEEFSLRMVDPYVVQINACPKAWSPGFESDKPLDVVYLDARRVKDLAQYKGKLAGKIVLIGTTRPTEPHFDPQAQRMTAAELATLVTATGGRTRPEFLQPSSMPSTQPTEKIAAPASRPSNLSQGAGLLFSSAELDFAAHEHAAVILDASRLGDGGTIFVAGAVVPLPTTREATEPTVPAATTAAAKTATTSPTTRPRAWLVDDATIPPQATLAIEDFNRLVHMLSQHQHVTLSMHLKVHSYPIEQTHTCNTIAEIPGSDLKDQIVMVGAHLDSWQAGTGATDNAVGSACAIEAVRIIKALNLHPRRTIRVALWTGEEQGLFGSTAYVKDHFGFLPDEPSTQPRARPATGPAEPDLKKLVKKNEYDRLSVYFNLDNGTGKIRGIYAQSNGMAVPYFHDWLRPFTDLDAESVTLANTGSTDHIPFDHIGLPGFQFIQDPIEYGTRTHHSNEDVFDRIQIGDMKQASTIMAAMLWDAANLPRRFPRKG